MNYNELKRRVKIVVNELLRRLEANIIVSDELIMWCDCRDKNVTFPWIEIKYNPDEISYDCIMNKLNDVSNDIKAGKIVF